MSNKRAYYYPLPIYLLLLLMVWVGAFFVDVVQLLSDGTLYSSSLISAEGVRWALRTALPSIDALQWGTVMMLVLTYGLLRGSGLTKVLWRLLSVRRLTISEWRALLFSLVALICYIALLYMATISPWSLLSGVTDELALSPLLQGWELLLFVGALFVSLIYGFIYGSYRSMLDVVVSAGSAFILFAPAMMTLLPAAGIAPCLQYAGVKSVCGLSWDYVNAVLYLLPFIYIMALDINAKRMTN